MNQTLNQMGRAIRGGMRNGYQGMNAHGKMDHPLSDDELRRYAPSVFADSAHESRSERFAPIATIAVVNAMREQQFMPFEARQAKTRDITRQDFTKHMIRFRRMGDGNGTFRSGDAIMEIVLVNANDGSSSYQLFGGLFRTLCLNGLIVADSLVESVRIGHKGQVVQSVVDGSYRVLEGTQLALRARDEWAGIALDRPEQEAFAKSAHMLRFGEDANNGVAPIALLNSRRREDEAGDLWTVFNRVQENAMVGGLQGRTPGARIPDGHGGTKWKPARRVTTRPVNGIDQDVKLNKALWSLAESMANLKTGKNPDVIDAEFSVVPNA